MNPAWMLSDEDREERRRRRQLQANNTRGSVVAVPQPREAPVMLFTAEELLQLQRIISEEMQMPI